MALDGTAACSPTGGGSGSSPASSKKKGAVLTAFIGVDGPIYQMAQDRCLPQILRKNAWRQTNHVIIVFFLLLSLALVVLMKGQVAALAGVYSLAFLGVLGAFIIGAMLLKTSPKHGPALAQRGLMVPWWHLALALALVSVSLLGNVLSADMGVFLSYLLPIFVLCVFCMYADRARAHLCCPVTNAAARLFGVGAISRSPISSPKDTKDGDGNNNNTAGGGGGAVRKSSPPTVLSVADFHMATTTLTSVAPASSLPPPTAGSCTWGSV